MAFARIDAVRVASVLHAMPYPDRKWQVVAQADYYEADAQTGAARRTAPLMYWNLSAVLDALMQARQFRASGGVGGQVALRRPQLWIIAASPLRGPQRCTAITRL
jgi:hypothetical protein